MSIVLFAGPSLPAAEIHARLDATVLPPARAGDLLRVARTRPRAIALVDGVFDQALPVWHKEILWALAQGVHVFGAASMGALRAAELHRFGMVGVGRIFAAYRDGALEADDEVAVLHGPAEAGHAAVTEALVNVRATLARAVDEAVLAPVEAAAVLDLARAQRGPARTGEGTLARAESSRPDLAARLRPWLGHGRGDQKRLDARELVERLLAFGALPATPFRARFAFAGTEAWEVLWNRTGAPEAEARVLDELRLRPRELAAFLPRARLRGLARHDLACGAEPDGDEIAAALDALRRRCGLWRRDELERWAAASGLDGAALRRLLMEEARLARVEREAGAALELDLLAELRASGRYAALAAEAARKDLQVAAAGGEHLQGQEGAVAALLAELARAAGDEHAARAALAERLGFVDVDAMMRAVLRETLFRRMDRGQKAASNASSSSAPPDSTVSAGRDRV